MMDNPTLAKTIDDIVDACEICTKNGQPKTSRKISLTHVNEAFNQELQIDFFYYTICGVKRTVMNTTDAGTGYSELSMVPDRSMPTIVTTIDEGWVCRHGAPKATSADDEYNKLTLRNYLTSHEIVFKPRPARRHNKIGIVERKNGTIKTILAKLTDENSTADASTILSRANLLANLFSGNRLLSSFELARGYRPSILGIPSTVVTADLLQAHKEQVAVRTLQRLLHSRAPNVIRPDLFNVGDDVWIYYRTSKQNEKDEWIRATVVKAEEHFLTARRSTRGPPMRVAYEDVRFAPTAHSRPNCYHAHSKTNCTNLSPYLVT